jgi:hypothetical protein
MAGQLIPPPDMAPAVPPDATPKQCFELWVDLMKTTDAFLFAGLRREVGPEGDMHAAYRQWYSQQRKEHDQATAQLLQHIAEAEGKHGN